MAKEAFHQGEHVIALDEAHLQVQLSELELTVSTCILITVTASDLEVLVHTADHQDLFEELRALGKGIEFSRVVAAGDQEVPSSLWGAAD
jgi:hypothetical protein